MGPLTRLTQKEVRFNWDVEFASFKELKQRLTTALVLALPKGLVNLVVYSDASNERLGAVLMQNGKVIAYASKKLKPYEGNIHPHDLELATIAFALKKWRHCMYGLVFTVYTD